MKLVIGLGNMKLLIGLGNPGPQYEHTRHNVGFRVVDKLAAKHGWKWTERRSRAILASGMIGSEKVILAKPITFMNRSGEAVSELVRWYKGSRKKTATEGTAGTGALTAGGSSERARSG